MDKERDDARAAVQRVMDISYGLWRSQTMYAGVELGVFDTLGDNGRSAAELAGELELTEGPTYRLLRGLSSLGLLEEDGERRFELTAAGELLQSDHPASLQGVIRIINGPEFFKPWLHLPDFVRDGEPNPFSREFGQPLFERARDDPEFGSRFNEGMTSITTTQLPSILDFFEQYDTDSVSHVCDIGGGEGYLLSQLLTEYPQLDGTVLDLPSVDELVAPQFGVDDRCRLVTGDMFESVPEADRYTLKHVLHDWDDDDCVQLLSTVHDCAPPDARLLVFEPVVPETGEPHYSKLFDIYMMCTVSGRLRTLTEYDDLLTASGWERVDYWQSDENRLCAIEAVQR